MPTKEPMALLTNEPSAAVAISLLLSRAQWGWARAHAGGSFTTVCATAEEAINRPKSPRPGAFDDQAGADPRLDDQDRDGLGLGDLGTLVSATWTRGDRLSDITPAELEALGPCPNL